MTKPFAIDLFAGAGGASLGIKQAGYHSIGFDFWPTAVETHNANGMNAKVADLSTFRISKKRRGRVDLIWASPPCQPFSNARALDGRWDPRDGFPHYLRALKRIRPRLTVLENVAGLTSKRHEAYLAKIVNSIRALGYTVEYRLLNTADYHIPQTRRRLIIIGRLDGKPRFPKVQLNPISVFDALGTDGSDNPIGGSKVVYTKNPKVQGIKGTLLYNGRGRPLVLNAPSLTIYAAGGNHVHWFDTLNTHADYYNDLASGGIVRVGEVPGARRITVEQMAALQGFPEWFKFCGPPSAQIRQIGNAVPARLAKLIVKKNMVA